MSDSFDPTQSAMKILAEAIAQLAEESAEAWKDVPGDVALRALAKSIRNTNLANFDLERNERVQ